LGWRDVLWDKWYDDLVTTCTLQIGKKIAINFEFGNVEKVNFYLIYYRHKPCIKTWPCIWISRWCNCWFKVNTYNSVRWWLIITTTKCGCNSMGFNTKWRAPNSLKDSDVSPKQNNNEKTRNQGTFPGSQHFGGVERHVGALGWD